MLFADCGLSNVTVPAAPQKIACFPALQAPFELPLYQAELEPFQVPLPPVPAPVVELLLAADVSLSQYTSAGDIAPTKGAPSLNLNKSPVPPSSESVT